MKLLGGAILCKERAQRRLTQRMRSRSAGCERLSSMFGLKYVAGKKLSRGALCVDYDARALTLN